MKSLFAYEETLCERIDNKCKRRNKCRRFTTIDRDGHWVADYYHEFGKFCEYFIPVRGEDVSEAKDNQR